MAYNYTQEIHDLRGYLQKGLTPNQIILMHHAAAAYFNNLATVKARHIEIIDVPENSIDAAKEIEFMATFLTTRQIADLNRQCRLLKNYKKAENAWPNIAQDAYQRPTACQKSWQAVRSVVARCGSPRSS